MSDERQNGLTRVSKETLLCWKMLLAEHVKHPSVRLESAGDGGAEINQMSLYLASAEITTSNAWGTDQPGKD